MAYCATHCTPHGGRCPYCKSNGGSRRTVGPGGEETPPPPSGDGAKTELAPALEKDPTADVFEHELDVDFYET